MMRNFIVLCLIVMVITTVKMAVTFDFPEYHSELVVESRGMKFPTASPTEKPTKSTKTAAGPIKLVVSTNKGFWKFFINWYYHASKIYPNLLDMLVVVAKDDYSRRKAIEMGINTVHTPHQTQHTGAVDYDSHEYKKMVSQRPRYLLEVMETFPNHNLLYTDVDTVLTGDILRLVDNKNDFMAGIEVFDYQGHAEYYCTGILFVKNNRESKSVLEKWRDEMEKKNNVNQPTFNNILYAASDSVTFSGFDQFAVMSGKTAKRFQALPDKTVLVHANYIQGAVNKAKFLKKYGLWARTGNDIVAVCTSSRSVSEWNSIDDSDLWRILILSINRMTTEDQYYTNDLRLYVAFDDDDGFWLENGPKLQEKWNELSPHPLTIITKVFKRVPSTIPWNNITMTAYNDGVEYFLRVNDDTEIRTKDWVTMVIKELSTMDNFGVVGPKSMEGNTNILVHDAVHRSHIDLFGFYYPPFKNWYIDNWITFVYRHRTKVLHDLNVKHHISKTRYEVHSPSRKEYKDIMARTSEKALLRAVEERIAVMRNGHDCSMVDDGERRVLYFDENTSIQTVYNDHFPSYFVVCKNDTIVGPVPGKNKFRVGMLGTVEGHGYHVTHVTDYMLYGTKAVEMGKAFGPRIKDRSYLSNIKQY